MRGHQGAPKGPSLFSHRTRPCRVGVPTVSITSHSRALARVQVGIPALCRCDAGVPQDRLGLRSALWGRRASALGLGPALGLRSLPFCLPGPPSGFPPPASFAVERTQGTR